MRDNRVYVILFVLFLLTISISTAELVPVSRPSPISTGETTEWFYVKVDSIDKDKYVGINKLSRGEFGFADDGQYYGKMWMVPAYQVAGAWYLCPIRNIETVNSVTDLGNGWEFDVSDSALTCYEYNNYANSVDVPMDVVFSFETNKQGQTKINVTTTISGYSPTDTGFGFLFFPEDTEKYRYVRTDYTDIDLLWTEQDYAVDKDFAFLDSSRIHIGDWFDWSDMIDTGTLFSETLTIGTKKGYLVGSYGYGASTTITIDPLYEMSYNTSIPSYALKYGQLNYSNDNSFINKYDISENISDGNTATGDYIYVGEPYRNDTFIGGYNLNNLDVSGSVAYNDMAVYFHPAAMYKQFGVEFYSDYFNLTPNNMIVGGVSDFNVGSSDFTMCSIIDPDDAVDEVVVLGKGDFAGIGYRLQQKNDNKLKCVFSGSTDDESVETGAGYDVGGYHTACCIKNGTQLSIWVDGSVIQTKTRTLGNLDTSNKYFTVGADSSYSSSRFYKGYVDSFGVWKNTVLTDAEMDTIHASKSIYNRSTGHAISVYFNHTFINNDTQYTLRVIGDNDFRRPLRIYYYKNMTDINQTSYKDVELLYGSFNYYNVNDIIIHNTSYPFRITLLDGDPLFISDVSLYELLNDTTPPTILNQRVNDMDISCNDSIIYYVDVTDDSDVASVEMYFTSDKNLTPTGFHQNLNRLNETTFYYEWNPTIMKNLLDSLGWSFNESLNISVINVTATDLVDLSTTVDGDAWALYTCTEYCVEDWQVQYGSCLTDDSQLKYYIDSTGCGTYDDIPLDNGTYIYCNYCSEDVVIDTESDCYLNGTYGQKDVTYTDNNYMSCCALTGLVSDCSIDYSPYNDTVILPCEYISSDFSLSMDDNLYFGYGEDKVFGLARINGSSNTSYHCISYVSTLEKKLIQTNPDYEQVTDSVFSLSGKKYEDREFFVAHNNLVNVYWTNENLVIDGRGYIFSVECSDEQGNQLLAEHIATVNYEPVNSPITRWFWANENMSGLIMGLVILAILIFILGFVITSVRRAK